MVRAGFKLFAVRVDPAAAPRAAVPVVVIALAALALALWTSCGGRSDPPRLLVLITVDTLRADRLGAYGGEQGLTPNLDAFAAQSLVFEAAYAPTSFTLPSLSALMTGRYPESIGVLGNRSALAPTIPTLAGRLRERGWRTAAVVGNLVLRKNAGLANGFDHYDDDMADVESARGWPERVANDTTDAALAVLDSFPSDRDDRLFLWIHYQDPHGPYTPPDDLRTRFLAAARERPGGDRNLSVASGRDTTGRLPAYQVIDDHRDVAYYTAGYDAEIHYLDREIGRLLLRLDEDAIREQAIVVFTADHGEALGEHDYWFAHGDRLDDALVRVPLMMRLPDRPPGRRLDIAGLIDLHPTLLRAVSPESGPVESSGRDLFAADASATDSVPYLATLGSGGPTRYGIVADGHKFVMTREGGGWRQELFRIGHEHEDLARTQPERARSLSERLLEFRRNLEIAAPAARQRLDALDQQNLRALGYIEEPDPTDAD